MISRKWTSSTYSPELLPPNNPQLPHFYLDFLPTISPAQTSSLCSPPMPSPGVVISCDSSPKADIRVSLSLFGATMFGFRLIISEIDLQGFLSEEVVEFDV